MITLCISLISYPVAAHLNQDDLHPPIGGQDQPADSASNTDTDELRKKLEEKQKQIDELESRLQEIKSTKNTLKNQISYFDNQIILTTLKIKQTESQIEQLQKQINQLSDRIEQLNVELDLTSELLAQRIVRTYKQTKFNQLELFLSANGFSELFSRYKYIRSVQVHDKQIIYSMERTKQLYDEQKQLKVNKQTELNQLQEQLDQQEFSLNQQKKVKETILETTKNDEKNYQELLAAARAEQAAFRKAISEAIQLLKDGTPIEKGTQIALMGNSGAPGCSTATHLHFEITDKNGNIKNPADYLKPEWNIVWDHDDPHMNFTGQWDWPMQNPRITQNYGVTSYSWRYSNNFHTGIDMVDDSSTIIKTPQSGTLYKGSTYCRGDKMNYVAVEHDDVISWYWHVQ
jgi:peptidoglycan hydrolase CwlO-like protein